MTGETPRSILVVDDEKLVRWSLCQAFATRGHLAREAANAAEARVLASSADAVVLDYWLPDASGFELLDELVARAPRVPVIMMTAHREIAHAVEAMRRGAWHYIAKPFELDAMCDVVDAALRARPVVDPLGAKAPGLVAQSPAMRELVDWLALVAPARGPVLLGGESGTGKNLVARALHEMGPRRDGPFVHITCSAVPEALLETELFGHEAGAFTGAGEQRIGLLERADGGTVFLDEISELSLAAQAKLLRFLEDGGLRRVGGVDEVKVDARVVSATNVDLDERVAAGTFRRDLYYRLRVLEGRVPALRERPEDIPALVASALSSLDRHSMRVPPAVLRALVQYSWPGNVRELRNVIERAVMMADGDVLRISDLALERRSRDSGQFKLPDEGLDLEAFEREMLRQALSRTGNNRTRAAELLGLTRDAVRYRIAKYDGEP